MDDLANVFWRALSGTQARLSTGTDRARRFVPGFPHIVAFADPANPDLAALAPFCAPGERFYCAEWSGPAPAGWKIEVDTFMCAMAWSGGRAPSRDLREAVRLGPEHVPEMIAMAAATRPGPFADRPMEIGEWYGFLEGGRLVAMAGERAHCGELREVSGVCTLPDFQGRGFARRLTEVVIASQLARGLTPFLHVASANARARGLYGRMGFVVAREAPMRVISRAA
jgi:ribosomal protein S18 acetylase RimI-like enzyme